MNLVGWDNSLIEYLLWNPTSIIGLIKLIIGLITLNEEWIMWSMIFTISMPITTCNALHEDSQGDDQDTQDIDPNS